MDNRAFTDLGVGTLEFGIYVQMCNEARWADGGGRMTRRGWVPLRKGELIFGRDAWAEKFKVKPGAVRGVVNRLEEAGFISQHQTSGNTIITVTYIASAPDSNQSNIEEPASENPGNRPITKTKEVKKKKEEVKTSLSSPDDEQAQIPFQAIADMFNQKRGRLPAVAKLSEPRKAAIRGRWEDGDLGLNSLDAWSAFFGRVWASDFLQGKTGWTACGFDWLLKPANMLKVIEGNYDNKAASPAGRKLPTQTDYANTHYGEGGLI